MLSPTSPTLGPAVRPFPSQEAIDRLRQLNDRACFQTGWQEVQAFAPVRQWSEVSARIEGARLVRALGDDRLCNVLHLLNYRQHPDHPAAFVYHISEQAERLGMIPVLRRLHRGEIPEGLSIEQQADVAAMESWLYAALRDFEPAHRAIQRAIALAPESWWVQTQHSRLLAAEDRYDEALEIAKAAHLVCPTRAAPTLQLVDCLVFRNRDEEAMELLQRLHPIAETGAFAVRLVAFHSEREEHAKALHYLQQAQERMPLMDRDWLRWLRRRRADMLYLAGDFEGFLTLADQLPKKGYHQRVAQSMRLDGALEKRRKRLEVPFVRQHSMTCAPATLTAIAAFWGKEVDHLAVAEAICYEGTPWHKERVWAEENGFVTREFRLTQEVLVELIDRGLPFTLTTQSISSGHLQACIGYDERQQIALLRDPTERHYGEIIIEGLIKDHPVQGPRCLLLLPASEQARLEGIDLPDAADYDAHHAFSVAVDAHQREAAQAAIARMTPGSPLALWSLYKLALYDKNVVAGYDATKQLVERFPESVLVRYYHLGMVQRRGNFYEGRDLIAAELARPDCDPIFYSEMGDLLMRDARHANLADYYLRKALRYRSRTASCYASMSDRLSREWRLEEANWYQRATTCLEPSWEPYAERYGALCRFTGQPEQGLAFLRQRVKQQGKKDTGPWLTLARFYDRLNRAKEELETLEAALLAHPEEGALWLEAGAIYVHRGFHERGFELMKAARGKVHERLWQLHMGRMLSFLGRRVEALPHWEAYVALEPQSEEGHRTLASLLANEEGREAGLRSIEKATEAHPNFPDLWELRAEWEERVAGLPAAIESAQKAVALAPNADWHLRSLALYQFRAGQREEAFATIAEALRKNPHSSANHREYGAMLKSAGRKEEALAAFRKALSLDVDDEGAASLLFTSCADKQERLQALQFLEGEMHRQVSTGDIVGEYRSQAYRLLEPPDLLARLRKFCDERPDLWQTWQALLDHTLDMELKAEAIEIANELTGRFPLIPRVWIEKARTESGSAKIESLRKAVSISPDWMWANQLLATALEENEEYEAALGIHESALHRNPLDASAYGYLSDLLWNMGRQKEAFEQLYCGMKLCPTYHWGWTTLASWARSLGRTGEVLDLLESHVSREAYRADWWSVYAEAVSLMEFPEKALEIIAAGIELHPDRPVLFEEQAIYLCDAGRFDEALAACQRGLELAPDSIPFRGRIAWIKMQQGQATDAIDEMRLLLERQPDYVWGLRHLINWLENRGEWEEVLALAKSWVRYEPKSSVAYSSLAFAWKEQKTPDRLAAKEAFAKAFALSPSHSTSGRNLLSYQVEDGEFEAAEQTLRTLEHFDGSLFIKGDAIELALAKKDWKLAEQLAQQILDAPEAEDRLYRWMPSLFQSSGKTKLWNKLLSRAIRQQKDPSAALIKAWVRMLKEEKSLSKAPRRIEKIVDETKRIEGWVAFLDESQIAHQTLYRFWIWRRQKWLASHQATWAEVGEVYLNIGLYRQAHRWLSSGTFPKESLSAETLFNQAAAKESVEGWGGTLAAREEFIQRFPGGSLATATKALLGLAYTLSGRAKEADEMNQQIGDESVSRYYHGFIQLQKSLRAAANRDETLARSEYEEALEFYNSLLWEKSLAQVFEQVQDQLAQHLDWARGKGKKVRSRWGRYKGQSSSDRKRWVAMAFFVFVLLKLLRSVMGS